MDNDATVIGELLGEADEPPEKQKLPPRLDTAFVKSLPPMFARRESLLTRQLHHEPEHTEDEHHRARAIVRGMSTWSNPSATSTASLTSDNDLTSPGTRDSTPSPPLPPTILHAPVPILDKLLRKEPAIVGQVVDGATVTTAITTESPEKVVEVGLGRRRCITFACGRKPSPNGSDANTTMSPEKPPSKPEQKPAEPPKRKCAITFACTARPSQNTAPVQEKKPHSRNTSPPPTRAARPPPSPKPVPKAHRGSDSTVKNESPRSLRKPSSLILRRRKYSEDNNDVPSEERRFHEFGLMEPEQWLEESGCYRNRLTVNDTLLKENFIRRIGEEVEEEALEDDDDLDEDDDNDDDDVEDDDEEDDDDDDEDDDDDDVEDGTSDHNISDAGFQTDDEDGFAVSDSDNDDSENEWWAPGRSTAATSTDHLEHHIRPSPRPRAHSQSSLDSISNDDTRSRPPQGKVKRKTQAMKIHRPGTPDLPDSTDFVCGTLDEDRPLEQAYISCLEQRKAAKHKARPQDIDPTFPTSDPEMDEEDDDDSDDGVEESDHPVFLHGKIDLNNDDSEYRGRRQSAAGLRKKTPSPPLQRLRSPPPPKRTVHRSPPPPTKRISLRSPPPAKKNGHKSPARRNNGQSPKRLRSPPPPCRRLNSPAPSGKPFVERTPAISFTPRATLAQRPQPTHTASLPRVASTIRIGKNALTLSPVELEEPLYRTARGAIDIVKGLEKKRQRRREKLYQKHCNKAGKDRERRPKPGKGAERMREVGLEVAAYKGKTEHMLSY